MSGGTIQRPSAAPPAPPHPALRAVLGLAGCGSVAALLAWVSELGPFWLWFVAVGIPAQVILVVAYQRARRRSDVWLTAAMTAGVIGGVIGTVGYDLFRVPFVAAGFRVLAPIDSYGVLLLDAASSSPWTGLAGWTYHFLNGIGFGVAYAVVAKGRHWGWGVAWAMVLESATVFSPFASVYALEGKWGIIAIAYAAHVPYGIAIGLAGQRADDLDGLVRESRPRPLLVVLGVVFVGLVLWLRPTTGFDTEPRAVIERRSFSPEWLRVPEGACATVQNRSGEPRALDTGQTLDDGETAALCFDESGVHRVRVVEDGEKISYSGGWVIVDPEA